MNETDSDADCSVLCWSYDTVPDNVCQNEPREPCPFCGAQSSGFTYSNGYPVLACGNCGATGPQLRDVTKDGNENDYRTLLLWNHRGKWAESRDAACYAAGTESALCPDCGGGGSFRWLRYPWVEKCWRCDGTGRDPAYGALPHNSPNSCPRNDNATTSPACPAQTQ